MTRILFVTHPDVVLDPAVPVPRWPLNARGRARMSAFARAVAGEPIAAVWTSDEQKALDGGDILSAALGVPHLVDPELGENDRSSTGYLAGPEFWEVVAAFFGRPDESIRGWETARHAQARIVAAVGRVATAHPGQTVAIVSHGGVARLLTAHLQGVEIGSEARPGNPNGGCVLVFDTDGPTIERLWSDVEDWPG